MTLSRIRTASALLVAALLLGEAVRHSWKSRPLAVSQVESSLSRSKQETAPTRSKASWFKDVSNEINLDFIQAVGPLGTHFMPEINGSGGALFDFDNDGDLDLFLVNLGKSPKATSDFPPNVNVSHRFYRHEKGGVFSDQTTNLGLTDTRRRDKSQLGIGCAIGDVNNDGFADIYVTNYGPDQLFINEGGRRFVDRTDLAQLGCPEWGTAAAFFDYDRDGWLDLIVVNYCADDRFGHSIACGFTDGTVSYCGPQKFQPTIDRLYHNDGPKSFREGVPTFSDVTNQSGVGSQSSYGLGLAISDFDGDKWPDIFIANDMRENRLWMNQHDGTFREEAELRGVALSSEGMKQGCMGVACADIDQDSDFDLLVTNLVTEGVALYINNGLGVFQEKARELGFGRLTSRHTGWGVALVDLDLDGNLDLPMVNGFVVPSGSMFPPHGEDQFQDKLVEVKHADAFVSRYFDKNLLLLNRGMNQFSDESIHAGDFIQLDASSRGLIYGDIDADGDIDLVTTAIGSRARVFRNDMPRKGHWLKIRCRLPMHTRDALGAVVRIRGGSHSWTAQLSPASSYLASNESCIHFGLGNVARIEKIDVIWPDGSSEVFGGTDVDRTLLLVQGTGKTESRE